MSRRRKNSTDHIQILERRVLLAAAVDLKHGPLAKVGALAPLLVEYQAYVAEHGSAAGFEPKAKDILTSGDGVAIEVFVNPSFSPKTLETKLTNRFLRNAQRFVNGVSGILPFAQINSIASLSELASARPVWASTNTGSVNSQGDTAQRGNIARSTYPYTGSGVKVGVLSDSYNALGGAAADMASGDLPPSVQVIQDLGSGTDEGRAMLQLVYDTAPGASLGFATAFTGQTGFANNIKALRDAGYKVIVDDVYYYAEPMFQDGVIAQAVDNVVATGSSYFSSAGNSARQGWDSAFRAGRVLTPGGTGAPTGAGALTFYGGTTHDFDPGAGLDDMQQFTLGASQTITLSFQWDQPYGSVPGSASSASDIDIYVLNSAGTAVIAEAAIDNTGAGKDPTEVLQFQNPNASTTTYQLMIVKYSDNTVPNPGMMKYISYDSGTFSQWTTNSGALSGHTNAAGANSVAAAPWYNTPAYGVNPPLVESFSSRGSTPILFTTTGVSQASVTRPHPNFTAPDGGNTTFFYADSASDPDTTPNFFGTSASAPAAAAIAALMLQANSALTPAQITTTLQNTALDMDNPDTGGFDNGFDYATGYGLVRADAAVGAIAASSITGQVYEDRNGNATFDAGDVAMNGVTVNLTGTSSGNTVTSGSGNYSFSGLFNGSYNVSETLPTGYIRTTAATINVNISSVSVISNQNFGNFPIAYNGTSGNDTSSVSATATDDTIVHGGVTYTIAKSLLTGSSLSFNLSGGDDLLTVYYTNGNPVPSGGNILYDGGAQTTATGDRLIINGTANSDFALISISGVTLASSLTTTTNLESVTVNGLGSADTFSLVAEGLPFTLNGGDGNDIFNFSALANITGAVTINGDNDTDTITLNDSASGGANAYTLTSTSIARATFGGLTYASAEAITLKTESGNNAINVNSTLAATPITLEANGIDTATVQSTASGTPITLKAMTGADNVNVNTDSTGVAEVIFPVTQTLGALAIGTGGKATLASGGARVLTANTLSFTGGQLDLTDNDLIVKGMTRAAVEAFVKAGFGAFNWLGTGITSSTAAAFAQTDDSRALGVIDNADWGYGTFSGETVAGTDILVKYTWTGDANVDGLVDNDDFGQFLYGFNGGGTPKWINGDFDFNGIVDNDDFGDLLAGMNAFNASGNMQL